MAKTLGDYHHIAAALIIRRLVEAETISGGIVRDLLAGNLEEYSEDDREVLEYNEERFAPELDKLAQFAGDTILSLTECTADWLALKDENT